MVEIFYMKVSQEQRSRLAEVASFHVLLMLANLVQPCWLEHLVVLCMQKACPASSAGSRMVLPGLAAFKTIPAH